MTPRLYAIAAAAELDDPQLGAALALALGQLAAAARATGVPWSLWLRDHDRSLAMWLQSVATVAWVTQLGGDLGVTLPADVEPAAAAAALAAAGVARLHVPQHRQPCQHPGLPSMWACHSPAEIARARAAGAGAAVLSPIWPTASKPGQPALGLAALAQACAAAPGAVVALGGIDAETAAEARAAGAAGVASLTSWRTAAPALCQALRG